MQKTCEEEAHIWQKARPGSHSQSLQPAQYHLTFGWCSLYSKGSFGGSRLPGCRNQPNSHDFTANTWSEKRRYDPLEMAALGDSQSKRLGREGQRKRDAKKNKNREKQEWKEGEKTKRKRKKGGWSEEGKKIGRVRQQNKNKQKTSPPICSRPWQSSSPSFKYDICSSLPLRICLAPMTYPDNINQVQRPYGKNLREPWAPSPKGHL